MHSSHNLVVRAGHRPLGNELAVWQPCLVIRHCVGPWEVGDVVVDLAEYLNQLARLLCLRLLLSGLGGLGVTLRPGLWSKAFLALQLRSAALLDVGRSRERC